MIGLRMFENGATFIAGLIVLAIALAIFLRTPKPARSFLLGFTLVISVIFGSIMAIGATMKLSEKKGISSVGNVLYIFGFLIPFLGFFNMLTTSFA